MAKLGEGDARWIVQDRTDGQNVNAWHWEERDLTASTHAALKSRLKSLTLVSDGKMELAVKDVTDLDGEVTIAQRKGKIMCYFELKFTIKYGGKVGEDKVEGKATVPEVDHDSFMNDFEIRLSSTDASKATSEADGWMQTTGRATIRSAIQKYFQELFEANNVGKNVKTGTPVQKPPRDSTSPPAQTGKTSAAPAGASGSATVEWSIRWRGPIEDIWTLLTDQGRASVYTRAPAKIDPRVGGVFEFLGGAISGYFTEVTHPTRLGLQWRLSSWRSGHFSTVVIVLEVEERGVTRMNFAQAGIPDGEADRVKQGWTVNFWEPIKIMFGFGMEFL